MGEQWGNRGPTVGQLWVIPRSCLNKPHFFADSKPPGWKIWVGDLHAWTTEGQTRQRIQDSLMVDGQTHLFKKVLSVAVKSARANSGASYATITVDGLGPAQVAPLQ